MASETGNGKTLAFLVPALQSAIVESRRERETNELRKTNSPLVLVVTPGRELATQIFNVAQDLCMQCGLTARIELSGNSRDKAKIGRRRDVDVLVGTFGSVQRLVEDGHYDTSALDTIVYDEADTLLDDTFNGE